MHMHIQQFCIFSLCFLNLTSSQWRFNNKYVFLYAFAYFPLFFFWTLMSSKMFPQEAGGKKPQGNCVTVISTTTRYCLSCDTNIIIIIIITIITIIITIIITTTSYPPPPSVATTTTIISTTTTYHVTLHTAMYQDIFWQVKSPEFATRSYALLHSQLLLFLLLGYFLGMLLSSSCQLCWHCKDMNNTNQILKFGDDKLWRGSCSAFMRAGAGRGKSGW